MKGNPQLNQPYPPQQQGWAGPAPQAYGQAPPSPPPGYGHPGQAPHAAPQPGAQNGMVLTLKYHPMTFMFGLLTPVVVINGQQVTARWGRNELPTPPGQYHVHVHTPYLLPRRIGNADTVVPVAQGQIVDVEYRAPIWGYSPGSLGPVPQRYNGVGPTIAVFAGVILLVLLLSIPAFA